MSNRGTAKVFPIICKGRKASKLVAAGRYYWGDPEIEKILWDWDFPIKPHAPKKRQIELVKFDHNPTSQEVLAEFARRGLVRPAYEDALTFGVKYSKEQRKHPIVFLHKPVDDCVLVLYVADGKRSIFLQYFDHRWSRRDVFAGIRK